MQGAPTAIGSEIIPRPIPWPPERSGAVFDARIAECYPPQRATIAVLCDVSVEHVELRKRNDCSRLRADGEKTLPKECEKPNN